MSTFVLIHGSWHGAWCWERVVPLLRAAGHIVIAPDLPGHGTDTTPLSPELPERYVPAVEAILDSLPEPAILVGHSSGGMIISEVARGRPGRVGTLVYLAAFLLPPGVFPPSVMRDDSESTLLDAMVVDRERGVSTVPRERAKEVFYNDCTAEDAEWAAGLLTPEPLIRPVAPENDTPATVDSGPERVFIECLRDRALGPATQRRMYTALPCRMVYSIDAGHSPFISAPEQLTACLLDIAATGGSGPWH